MKLKINEIFYSIQGESSYTGLPCIFIRLTYCNLRCSYCDTEYAFHNGSDMSINQILKHIDKYPANLVMVTGGEPLLQKDCISLMDELLKNKYSVMLETSGSLPLNKVPKKVVKIVDFKCPSSNMKHKNDWKILKDIDKKDEIKFVIGDKKDYNWSKDMIKEYDLDKICPILFSPVYDKINIENLSKWILDDGLNVRLQMQLHKYIWGADKKGV
ncbi:MAG: 7-carboxy-7-deazaguanine synthase [Candidatus Marinimicrobia bacterium]|nr:7-carboxy-7-deazaguanine synthase [Candidatus Neomarinimicrobiota bacterium]